MGGPWEKYAASSGPADPPWVKYGGSATRDFGLDWHRPHEAVRADIARLSDADRPEALRQWADAFVAKERQEGGAGMAIDNAARTLARGSFVGPFLDEATATTQGALHAVSGGYAGSPYDEALAYQRARDRAVDADYPALSTVGQIAGGLASAGGALRQGGSMAAKMATAGPAALVAPAATAGGRIAQGAGIGAGYGAVHGFGNSEGGVGHRAEGAVAGGLVGGAAGGVLTGVAEGVGRAFGHVAGSRAAARQETGSQNAGAMLAINRALERDRITPDDLMAQIRTELPRSSADDARLALGAPRVEQIVRLRTAGASTDDIATQIGVGPATVRRYLGEMTERSRGPLNVTDRAGMVRTGSGDNMQMTLRAAAATPGEARSIAREQLMERAVGTNARLGQAFDRIIGSGDYDGVAARHADALRWAGDTAYEAARQAEEPFDLAPIVNLWTRAYGNQRGPVPEAVNTALDGMMSQVPIRNQVNGMVIGNRLVPPRTLEQFINARQNLSASIEAARAQPSVQRVLIRMRNEMSDEVRRTNPQWGVANDIWRDGKAAEGALEAGARMALRLNAQTRDGLEEFTAAQRALRQAQPSRDNPGNPVAAAAAQARIDLFRVGLVRALNDNLANTNTTNDLTRTLRLPAARQILGTVLGRNEANRMLRVIDAEHAMNRTYASQFGSQTTPLKEAVDDLNWAPKMSSALDLLNLAKALDVAGTMVSSRYNAGRNARMMPLLTETDPIHQLDLLRALQGVTAARHQARQFPQRAGMIGAGMAGQVAGSSMADRRQ
jgi:hypothetical protein